MKKLGNQVKGIKEKIRNQVHWKALNQVYDLIRYQIYYQTMNQVYWPVREQVWSQVRKDLKNEQIKKGKSSK